MNIGEAAKKARKEAGLKRRELAEKSGYTYANIRNIENNLVKPKIETVIDLADTLGISIYEYIGMKPKVEVVEVKHGEWIEREESLSQKSETFAQCSVCGKGQMVESAFPFESCVRLLKHCPNCGAKMDLKEGV